jgi:hypothetical protein
VWFVDFQLGNVSETNKGAFGYVRAVRAGP